MSKKKSLPVACQDCTLEPPQLFHCRIREFQFKIFGKDCPREKELKPHKPREER